jgi:phage protein D
VTAAIPIYQGQEFYVPAFEVKLDGRPPGREVIRDILSVTYKDNLTEIDSFEISINNWDADTRDFKYSDQPLFDPGKQIELSMGYQGQLRKMLKGEITSLRPTFPAGAPSTLAVSGLNVLHRLRTKQESATYLNKTDSEIAEEIGNRLKAQQVKVTIKPAKDKDEPRLPFLIQENEYDILFLLGRARRIGYELTVDDSDQTVIKFGPSTANRRATYRLTYGKSLIEFQPELTTAQQVAKVTVRGWDAVRKQKIEKTVDRSQLATKGLGAKGGQAAIDKSIEQKAEIVATKPVQTEAEAEKLAKEILEGIAKEMVKATGSVPGLPDIRAGTVLLIDGLGDRFSGRYFVVGTTHTIGDAGYTTQFECRREEV